MDIVAVGLAGGIISIVVGILIIIFPHILSYIVAIYLIIIGALSIANSID